MADDIMPEEAARRRRLGEARRQAMRYPVNPEPVDAAIERQRAAARDMVARENPARVPLDTARANASILRNAARANLPLVAGSAAYEGRRSLRDAALGDFEAEGRAALEDARAARAVNRAARGRSMAGVGEGGTLQAPEGSVSQPSNDEAVHAELPPVVVTAEADREINSRNQRRNVQRPTTRMSPRRREMTADELNDIAAGVYTRGSGAASEPGQQGDIARRIAEASGMKKGGKVKKMAKGGLVKASSSAGRRGDGIASRGKTRGRMV